jgi:hypothetical protein
MVIDVSIEESQDDHRDFDESGTSRLMVFAAGGETQTGLGTPASSTKPKTAQNRWSRMKGFALKLRRNRSYSESVTGSAKDRDPDRHIP